MTGSSPRSEIDFERGVPTTPADVEALRRVRLLRRLSTEDYLRALARLPPPPLGHGRERRPPGGGEPFRLGRAG